MEHVHADSPHVIAATLRRTAVAQADSRTDLAARALAVARSTALGVLGDAAAAEDVARAALTLRYVHDLPDDAIARALGCRPATVRSLLSRGREALRETLETER